MARAKSHPWTPKQVAVLVALWPMGTPADEIATQVPPHSKEAVYGKVHGLGLKRLDAHGRKNIPKAERGTRRAGEGRAWTDAQVVIVRREWRKGTADSDIGQMTGRTAKGVRAKAQELGLERPASYLETMRIKAGMAAAKKTGSRTFVAGYLPPEPKPVPTPKPLPFDHAVAWLRFAVGLDVKPNGKPGLFDIGDTIKSVTASRVFRFINNARVRRGLVPFEAPGLALAEPAPVVAGAAGHSSLGDRGYAI